MAREGITTKAAKCPNCGKYHQISCIDLFKTDKETRESFAQFMIDGFDIIEVTTEDAKQNFGYCEPKPVQATLF